MKKKNIKIGLFVVGLILIVVFASKLLGLGAFYLAKYLDIKDNTIYLAKYSDGKDMFSANNLYKKACYFGDAESCNIVGIFLGQSMVTSQFFQKACDGKNAEGCKNLADMYSYGFANIHKDDNKAFELYKNACEFGDLCEDYNYILSMKQKNIDCENGNARSCTELADIYYKVTRFAQYKEKSFELYEKACNASNAEGCVGMGNIAERYDFQQQRLLPFGAYLSRAPKYYLKACNLGSNEGCYLFASHIDYESSTDLIEKSAILEKTCNRNDKKSCDKLGEVYYYFARNYHLKENHFSEDIQKAIEYYEKACYYNDQDGCNSYRFLISKGH